MYNPWVKLYRSKQYRKDCEICLIGFVNGVEEILSWSKLSLDADKINASDFATYDADEESITWEISTKTNINGVIILHKGKVIFKQSFSVSGWDCELGTSFTVRLGDLI